jgi:hypothetical protein
MQQRDIIQDQIEEMGRVLAKVFSEFLDLKIKGNIKEAIKVTNETLQQEVDLNINKIETLNKEELIQFIIDKKLNTESIELLVDYLFSIGDQFEKSDAKKSITYFNQSLHLLEFLDQNSTTFYMERNDKKELLKSKIRSINNLNNH